MNKQGKLYCVWADKGLALHNSGAALMCCHSRTFLKDAENNQIYFATHSLKQAWTSPTRQEIKDALDRGEQHENCAACWGEENAGHHSRRLSSNETMKDSMHSVIATDSPLMLDLKLGNVCNLACRTCNPFVSSKWGKDWWKVFESKNNNSGFENYQQYSDVIFKTSRSSYSENNHNLWDTLSAWLPYIQYIDVYGGEPMLTHKLFEIFRDNIEKNNIQNQVIHVNTNATVWNQDYIDILKKFKHVSFDLSIDGLYQQFDYIRHGETWNTVSENINKFMALKTVVNPGDHWPDKTIQVSVVITVSYLNVYYLQEIFDYFYQRGFFVHFNLAHTPLHVNIKALPAPVKKIISDKLSSSDHSVFLDQVKPVIEYLNQDFVHDTFAKKYDRSVWQEMTRITDELDQLRNQDFKTTFPEFWEVVEPYWN